MCVNLVLPILFALLFLRGESALADFVEIPVHVFQSAKFGARPTDDTELLPGVLRYHLGSVTAADLRLKDKNAKLFEIHASALSKFYDFYVDREEVALEAEDGVHYRLMPGVSELAGGLQIGVTGGHWYFILNSTIFTTGFLRDGTVMGEIPASFMNTESTMFGWDQFSEDLQLRGHGALFGAHFYGNDWDALERIPVRDLAPARSGRRNFALEHEVLAAATEIYGGRQNEVRVPAVKLNPLTLAYLSPHEYVRATWDYGRAARDLPSPRPHNFARLALRHQELRPQYLVSRWQREASRNPPVVLNRRTLVKIGCTEAFLEFALSL